MAQIPMYLQGILLIFISSTLVWLLSVRLKNASIVDVFWGFGFVMINALWYFQGEGNPVRKLLLLALVSIWGLRLTAYIGWRNWGKPEDFRYQQFRKDYGAERYWWFSYFQVFLLQGGLICLIAMPLFAVQASGQMQELYWLDFVAAGVWAIGVFFESVGDWQMAKFKANPDNKGKVMDRGLWKYTRHPNYFGDAATWWGFGLFAIAVGNYWAPIGSLVMTGLILKVSGVSLLERTLKDTKPKYAEYIRKTSSFIPWFPKN